MGYVKEVYFTPSQLETMRKSVKQAHGLDSPNLWCVENSAYVPRAVSTVPKKQKPRLEEQYSALLDIVKFAGINPFIPAELSPDTDSNTVNYKNDSMLWKSKMVIPLCYEVSDGRGWEIGTAYTLLKPVIPILLNGQKINIPTIMRPLQVPLLIDDLTTSRVKQGLTNLLWVFSKQEFGIGECSDHGRALIEISKDGTNTCARCTAQEYFEVIPDKF